jgi:long-chain acyl-CoA synthetase
MNLAQQLARVSRLDPDRPALFNGTQPVATYGEWAQRAAGLAASFAAAGLNPGDRVVLFQRNHPRYLEVLLGAWWAGLVVVPVNAKLHPGEAQWIIDNAQARWAFVTSDVAPAQFEALERRSTSRPPPTSNCWRLVPFRWCTVPPTTSPGCSTPAAPPAGPRA